MTESLEHVFETAKQKLIAGTWDADVNRFRQLIIAQDFAETMQERLPTHRLDNVDSLDQFVDTYLEVYDAYVSNTTGIPLRLDPSDCGCTDCLIGRSVPHDIAPSALQRLHAVGFIGSAF